MPLNRDEVEVLLRLRDEFSGGIDRAGMSAEQFGRRAQGVGRTMTLGLTLPIAAAAGGALKLASDVEEAASKFGFVFGPAAQGAGEQLDEFAERAHRSRFEMREMAADVGAILEPMLGSKDAAADMSVELAELAVDLASFNNVAESDALLALRSGLIGQSEPMQRFGVDLRENTVKAFAFQHGIAKVGEELTEQQKVQARFALIMERTATAQGDAERTSDSFANTLRGLKAAGEETSVLFGEEILPLATDFVDKLTEVIKWVRELDEGTRRNIILGGGLLAAAGPSIFILGTLVEKGAALKRLWDGMVGSAARKTAAIQAQSRVEGQAASTAGGLGRGYASLAAGLGIAGAALIALEPLRRRAVGDLREWAREQKDLTQADRDYVTQLTGVSIPALKEYSRPTVMAMDATALLRHEQRELAASARDALPSLQALTDLAVISEEEFRDLSEANRELARVNRQEVAPSFEALGIKWEDLKDRMTAAPVTMQVFREAFIENLRAVVRSDVWEALKGRWEDLLAQARAAMAAMPTDIPGGGPGRGGGGGGGRGQSDAERLSASVGISRAEAEFAISHLGRFPGSLEELNAARRAGGFISRQHGGTVWPGQTFLVGERGPEVFIPRVPGHIQPNAGPQITINGPVYGFADFEDKLVEAYHRADRRGRIS